MFSIVVECSTEQIYVCELRVRVLAMLRVKQHLVESAFNYGI